MTTQELTRCGADELATLVRDRRVSAVEVAEAHLRRIERENQRLNAVVTLDGERALAVAHERDRAAPESRGLLHGVPLTLKDCHEAAGMRTTAGVTEWAEHVPQADSVVVARLLAAGAVVLGKTNVPPLLGDVQTSNPIFGTTNNPWDVSRGPGGSSGGAAAALAAGMTPLEIGSDIGGSIRIPSHCCGTFGLKPTEGRVSNHGHLPGQFGAFRDAWYMNSIGPMARNLDDLALAFAIIAGPSDSDPSPPPFPVEPVPVLELSQLRLAWCETFPGVPVAAEIREAIERLAAQLAGAGAVVERVLPDRLDWEEQAHLRHTLREALRTPAQASTLAPVLVGRARVQHIWDTFFEQWDALIAPVMMTTAFPHCPRDTPISVDGVEQEYGLLTQHCRPFNLTGHPAVAMPIGYDRAGLPIGIQLVGARWRDELLLGVARALTEITGGFSWPGENETRGDDADAHH